MPETLTASATSVAPPVGDQAPFHPSAAEHSQDFPPVADVIGELDAWRAELAERQEKDPQALSDEVQDQMEQTLLGPFLEAGNYSEGELEELLTSIHDIDLFIGGEGFSWRYIGAAARTPAFAALSKRPGTILDGMIANGIARSGWEGDPRGYRQLIQATEQATSARFGSIGQWKQDGQVAETTPDIQTLASQPGFAQAYVEIKAEQIGQDPAQSETRKMINLRETEKELLANVLGVPIEAANDFQMAIDARTLRKNKVREIVPLRQGGGIDLAEWQRTLIAASNAVRNLRPEDISRINEKANIANFDRYQPIQLERLNRLLLRDPAELAYLRAHDVRMLLSDKYGDDNNTFGNNRTDGLGTSIGQAFETKQGTLLPFEMGRRSDIYRSFLLLDSLGVKPASLAFAAHGLVGSIFTGSGTQIVGEAAVNEQGQTVNPWEISIRGSSVNRIFAEFMQPSRLTGEREVILLSCLQAATRTDKGVDITPNAEYLALESNPADRVVVYAGSIILSIERTNGELIFLDATTPSEDPANMPRTKATAFRAHYVNPTSKQRGGRRRARTNQPDDRPKVVTKQLVDTISRM